MSTMLGSLFCCISCLWFLGILVCLYGLFGMLYNRRMQTRRRWPFQRLATLVGFIVVVAYIILR